MRTLILLLLTGSLLAQTTTKLGLNLPTHGTANWDTPLNQNFNILDNAAMTDRPNIFNNSGVFTNTQMNEYVQSLVGGISPNIFTSTQAVGQYATESLMGGVALPASVTVHQGNAVAGYTTTLCDSASRTVCNGVGGYFAGIVKGANGAAWGTNSLAIDTAGVSGANLYGGEFDISVYGSPSFVRGIGIYVNKFAGTMASDSTFLDLNGSTSLTNGITVGRGVVSSHGIQLGGLNGTNPTVSANIAFDGFDAGGVSHEASIQAGTDGSLQLNPSSGNATFIVNDAGVSTPSVDYSEISAPSGLTGAERCYGDSTAHALKCSYNNGSFLEVPQNAGTPTVNHAVCWKTANTLGYCSDQPDSNGACTCN